MLHIYNVHLGTAVLERRYQAARLAAFVHDHRIKAPKVILGDFNEWMKGLATQTLSALFESIDIAQHLKRRRTYPGLFPLLHLDHIYYEGDVTVRRHGAGAHAESADGVGPSAARGRFSDRLLKSGSLAAGVSEFIRISARPVTFTARTMFCGSRSVVFSGVSPDEW